MVTIRRASYPADRAALEALFAAYLADLFDRAPQMRAAVASKYPPASVPALVEGFARLHLAPRGELLIAERDGLPVGCGMMRELEPGIVEIQRVYVAPEARGLGLGRDLTLRLMDTARADGQRLVRLDTGPELSEAIALYTALGFTRRGAYRRNTPELEETLIYFERAL
jgi:putative acetyltransferase